MKKLTLFSLFILAAALNLPTAFAAQALPIRNVYSTTPILTSAYVQLVSSTVKGISGVSVLNTSAVPIALALGAAGSEVNQIVVPGTAQVAAPQVVFYPMSAGYGVRLSAISLGASTGTVGELEVNLFYN
jgi:hypothetical protein